MSEKKNDTKVNDDNKYALQMQIITFQDQTINNLKNIILEKEQEIQRKSQENTLLKQQLQQQDNSNSQQYTKAVDELKKLKVIFNQNSNPDIVMESLQLKEQVVIIQQQKTKLEIELKEAQTRLIQAQSVISELQRENYHLKQCSLPQNNYQQPPNNEENTKNLRKMQLKNELRQIPPQNRTQAQQRRAQQIEDELNYLEQF